MLFIIVATSCTNFREEEVPVSFGTNVSELSYDTGSSLRPVIISSGTKWSVATMPEWMRLESISSSNGTPYEWTANFLAEANDGYDREGQIVIKANTESAEIAVAQEGKKGKYVAVESVSLAPMELSLTEEESASLLYTILPSNASVKEVSWESSYTSVATVSETGEVNAISPGTAQITVTTADGGKTASCAVTVKAKVIPVSSVSLNKTSLTLTVGDTETLVSTVLPENATDPSVTWTSGNTSIATVSSTGEISAKAVGSTTITVNTNDGGKTAFCTLSVKPVNVSSVTLNRETLSLILGETATLTATVHPENAANKNVSWTSSNAGVASVDASGKVSAQSVGTAKITVTTEDGGKTASCSVTVSPIAVTGISLNKTTMSLLIGGTEKLTATVSPSNATNKNVSWTSSNMNIATVDSNGNVSAIKDGTVVITATTEDGGKKATCSVTVNPIAVTGVSLNKTSMSMTAGDTQTLTATITPSNATDKSVTWSSNNTSVATVSSSGVVTAKAAGMATITVTTNDGAKTASCSVSVLPVSVTNVSLNKSVLSMYQSDTETLIAIVYPSNASNKGITWRSSDNSVAVVNSYGQVTALAAGSAIITVTTDDGGKTASCSVNVQSDPYGAVDLGLSVKWASYNYGAASITDSGGYYMWGDPAGTGVAMYYSAPDVNNISGTQYDIVRRNWGGNWRIPTRSEINELYSKCTLSSATVNGNIMVKIIGPNGNVIYLPLTGYSYPASGSIGTTKVTDTDNAYMMSGESYKDSYGRFAYIFYFSPSGTKTSVSYNADYMKFPIRPVR